MKKILLYFSILLLSFLVQCNTENEDDLYYEPLVEGIFNVSVDPSQQLDFTIEPHKDLTVNGQFQNGIPFSIEFDASALKFYEPVEASIMPITGILDMPSDFQFLFGFVFSPEGMLPALPAPWNSEFYSIGVKCLYISISPGCFNFLLSPKKMNKMNMKY